MMVGGSSRHCFRDISAEGSMRLRRHFHYFIAAFPNLSTLTYTSSMLYHLTYRVLQHESSTLSVVNNAVRDYRT